MLVSAKQTVENVLRIREIQDDIIVNMFKILSNH